MYTYVYMHIHVHVHVLSDHVLHRTVTVCCCRVVTPNRTFYMYSSSVSETNSWVALIRSKVVSHTYSELFMYMYMYLYQYIIDIKYMYCTLHTCNMCSGLAFSVHLYMYTHYQTPVNWVSL